MTRRMTLRRQARIAKANVHMDIGRAGARGGLT